MSQVVRSVGVVCNDWSLFFVPFLLVQGRYDALGEGATSLGL